MKEPHMPDEEAPTVVGPDGLRYQIVMTADAEVTRGQPNDDEEQT